MRHTVAAAIRVRRGDRVLDIGCGAGGYGLSTAVRGAGEVVLTDIEPAAVDCALRNAERNGIRQVDGRVGSLFAPVRGERFDIIITTLATASGAETNPRRTLWRTRWANVPAEARRKSGRLPYARRSAIHAHYRLGLAAESYAALRNDADSNCAAWPGLNAPFQPAEYDAFSQGLFSYLDGRAQRGLAQYRRNGPWCYLGVSFFEAKMNGHDSQAKKTRALE